MAVKRDVESLAQKYGSAGMGSNKAGGAPRGGPHGRGVKGGFKKPKDARKTIRRLMGYLNVYKLCIAFVLVCVLLSTASMLIGSYMLRPIINQFIAPPDGSPGDPSGLLKGLAVMMAVYLVGVLSSYLQQRIMVEVSQRALQTLRNDLFDCVEKLPVRFYDTTSHGELMSRFTNDVDSVGDMLTNTVVQLFSGSITLIGTLAMMLYTNWILALITILFTPLFMLMGGFIAKRSQKYFSAQQKALGALNGYIEESVTGQKVVKVFNHEDICIEEFSLLNTDLQQKQIRAQFFGGIMGPVLGNLSQVSYSTVAAVGGVLCVLRGFDIGGLTIFVNYARQFSRPINEISMQVNTIFSALAGAERVFDIMDTPPEEPDVPNAIAPSFIEGRVRLNHVNFGYNPDKQILKDVSLYAKPGQKIAFVGSTGAGKTTITNLLNRFYDIQDGEITIDGHNIREFRKDYLRQNIAMVLQDTHLFTGTVMENIRYGRLDATDEEVIAAAKIASADSFIRRLENGYQTMLESDGANLSQGQRQLLNIARAAISKAPILVLDEATSSVDTRTEKHIEHGMDRIMATRTTFVIAHRLSTVRNADAIMVLENGEIIERGNHDQLLEEQGRYYALYTGVVELD